MQKKKEAMILKEIKNAYKNKHQTIKLNPNKPPKGAKRLLFENDEPDSIKSIPLLLQTLILTWMSMGLGARLTIHGLDARSILFAVIVFIYNIHIYYLSKEW